ncbi:atexp4,atexpa4,athexp alpha 1.6,expa4 [Pleodorina starrii]|uniref:Atexp4,atexpa4,athexp alpha 1.6,expa4 n=1 Tax=Pleodorina starrii TaxID=330485 RepID=A0A9W6F9A4_9CHLO|nr:atexp4 [Pleodorina starrii]GLC61109.1 atexp4,atexpa4,athexp alpha 1.6,expa4 [Pleodorina starrii]GLC69561.1 atexp4 [Pleodorina starrii]
MAQLSATVTGSDLRSAAPACHARRAAPENANATFHRRSPAALLTVLLGIICLVTLPYCCKADNWDGSWQKARATRYGGWDDGWNIHEGSCGYGYLDYDRSTGWNIAAMSDMNWDFPDSCGRCFEVRCDPTWISDNYGESFDRTGVCRDTEASVVVQLAENRWGVIGIITRPVSCDYEPEKRASVPPEGDSPPNTRISRPWDWVDRRPWP